MPVSNIRSSALRRRLCIVFRWVHSLCHRLLWHVARAHSLRSSLWSILDRRQEAFPAALVTFGWLRRVPSRFLVTRLWECSPWLAMTIAFGSYGDRCRVLLLAVLLRWLIVGQLSILRVLRRLADTTLVAVVRISDCTAAHRLEGAEEENE